MCSFILTNNILNNILQSMPYTCVKKVTPTKLNALTYYANAVLGMSEKDVAERFGVTRDAVTYHCAEFRRLSNIALGEVPTAYAKTMLTFYIPLALKATETMLRSNKRSKMVNSDGLFKFWQAIGVYKNDNQVVINIGNDTVAISSDKRFADMLASAHEVAIEEPATIIEGPQATNDAQIDSHLTVIPERPTVDTDPSAPTVATPTSTDDSQ
jgi:hypothetical protein